MGWGDAECLRGDEVGDGGNAAVANLEAGPPVEADAEEEARRVEQTAAKNEKPNREIAEIWMVLMVLEWELAAAATIGVALEIEGLAAAGGLDRVPVRDRIGSLPESTSQAGAKLQTKREREKITENERLDREGMRTRRVS